MSDNVSSAVTESPPLLSTNKSLRVDFHANLTH